MTIINVAKDFTIYPGGRISRDGPYSAQEFREKFLEPALAKENEVVVVELDGVRGYAASFLEEAFGGLIRRSGFNAYDVLARLSLATKKLKLRTEIIDYIVYWFEQKGIPLC